jgi:hypothetical protein
MGILTKAVRTMVVGEPSPHRGYVLCFKYKNVGLLRTAYQPVGPVVKCLGLEPKANCLTCCPLVCFSHLASDEGPARIETLGH